jgi:transcriptional regulator with XRE-family HTH domain
MDKKIETSIGENIQKIRIAKGWTRERIAELSGIKNLYMKEKGLRKITEHDIEKLSKALQCSKSEIVGDVDFKVDIFPETMMVKRYRMEKMSVNSLGDTNNILDKIPISTKFLKENMKSDNIIIIKYYGNGMFPYLCSNDDVFVDLSQRNFVNNSVFLIENMDNKGSATIRRAYKVEAFKDVITILCDNKDNGIQPLTMTEDAFNKIILGKVIYIGRNIEYM